MTRDDDEQAAIQDATKDPHPVRRVFLNAVGTAIALFCWSREEVLAEFQWCINNEYRRLREQALLRAEANEDLARGRKRKPLAAGAPA